MLKTIGFHEKSAWVMIAALVVASCLYFIPIITAMFDGNIVVPGKQAVFFVVIIVIIAIIGHILAALSDPSAANEGMDERDTLIARKSGHWSGMAMGFIVFAGLLSYLVLRSGDLLFHTVFGAMVVASIIEYALIIFSYRKGT